MLNCDGRLWTERRGVALIFGGEMSDFIRRLIMLVLVIALIMSAASLLTALFGAGLVMRA